ncbi:sulfotransferase ssu-1-like isoform X2 [Dermacentor albipictus]|uniref:sulfotransferase ssu-1-like isoform X2 n=1 Tax=Dermacentor albipictus TaxID=60249 RepID=UPI0031FE2EE1
MSCDVTSYRRNPKEAMDPDAYRDIEGLRMLKFFDETNVRFAMGYEPEDDDVIIVSYPKCGTTWTQYIVSNLFTHGNPPKTTVDFMLSSPIIELTGVDAVRKMPRPGALMTHLPYDKCKHSSRAKYIYVTRNPYDCCVSYYHFSKYFTSTKCEDVSFDKFLSLFLSGNLLYGEYFDHLLSWYPHRDDPNVLFLTYEKLQENMAYWVLRIADFLGEQYGSAFRNDESLLQKVLDSCTVHNMKTVFTDPTKMWIRKALNLPPERRLASLEAYRHSVAHQEETHRGGGLVRKGVVGDWKNHFSLEQIERMKHRIAEKTAVAPHVMNLWEGLQLPV